jgi:hypothetical protein
MPQQYPQYRIVCFLAITIPIAVSVSWNRERPTLTLSSIDISPALMIWYIRRKIEGIVQSRHKYIRLRQAALLVHLNRDPDGILPWKPSAFIRFHSCVLVPNLPSVSIKSFFVSF